MGLPAPFVNRFRDKFQRVVVQEHPFEVANGFFTISIITEDGYRVFLTKDKRCAIYDDRPPVCRKFGHGSGVLACHRVTANGRVRTPDEVVKARVRLDKLEHGVDTPLALMVRGYDID